VKLIQPKLVWRNGKNNGEWLSASGFKKNYSYDKYEIVR